MDSSDDEDNANQIEEKLKGGVKFGVAPEDDKVEYVKDIGVNEEEEPEDELAKKLMLQRSRLTTRNSARAPIDKEPEDFDPMEGAKDRRIYNRTSEYNKRQWNRALTPARVDPFSTPALQAAENTPGTTPGMTPDDRNYAKVLREGKLEQEKRKLENEHRKADEELKKYDDKDKKRKKRRWDQTEPDSETPNAKRSRWDATPGATTPALTPSGDKTPSGKTPSGKTPSGRTPGGRTPGNRWDATPGPADSRWGQTPGGATPGGATPGGATPGGATPSATGGRSRWDATPGPSGSSRWGATPGGVGATPGTTPSGTPGAITPGAATPSGFTPSATTPSGFTPGGATPSATPGGATPSGFTPGGVTPASRSGNRTPAWGDTPGGRTPGYGKTPGGRTPGGRTPGGRTPGLGYGTTPGSYTPFGSSTPGAYGSTPGAYGTPSGTPGAKGRRRWDETPEMVGRTPGGSTPSRFGNTPGRTPSGTPGTPKTPNTPMTPASLLNTPANFFGAIPGTPMTPNNFPPTPDQIQALRIQHDILERNRRLDDDELNEILPTAGFRILEVPKDYTPIRTPARLWAASPTPAAADAYQIPKTPGLNSTDNKHYGYDLTQGQTELPFIKPEEMSIFQCLLEKTDDEIIDPKETRDRRILTLLLKVKNGTPPQRKNALRQLSDNAREFGAEALFDKILPLLMQPTLEDQERHLLVKVIDRVLYKLDDLVRPYAHKILVVIEPLLIDEDYYARVEGREIIANLAKAAGLATMISTMRPDIDNVDEYVRNTTARAFSVVASALGIQSLLPFLKAVCQSKKSWQARHTGIKIVQQIAILMGCAVLPHLRNLVEIIEEGLEDDQSKVRTITALAVAALAEAAHPYGIEAFDTVLKPLWMGITKAKGGTKTKAAFLKAIGYIIPLMDAEYAGYYTREVMPELIAEFKSPDEEMKKIVLKVVKQCVGSDGVEPPYVKTVILAEFFKAYWNRRMALDRRNYKQLVQTTVEIAQKVGGSEIINQIVEDLRDENESYRKMVMETIDSIVEKMGVADVDQKLEEFLIDGILYAFQEQTGEDSFVMLKGFGTVVNSLGKRTKPYLPQICGIVNFRLNNKSARIRQQAADLISRIAPVLKICHEESLMKDLGKTLFEFLGEEYPDVLGSVIGALKAIVNELGMEEMNPPIKDILPRLTPIMKNRHEKVQENVIDLVGRIADRGAEYVTFREWRRIAYELIDMLKAHKKAIRRATVNTFGYIAKAVGPQDVLEILLNNLRVQERQNRVCTTVAIAIVAETCAPFTVLPALMNEYRVPELNVQNGVLKSLSFLFEYIGEMGKDYVYAVTPLLEDALMDRDLVHRQTACAAIKHMALGVYGLGREDALQHLLNYVWPNIFETSPHVINAVHEALEGFRVSLGSHILLQYTLQGLFHPARKVRNAYWKVYNSLYIGSQSALVAGYPIFEADADNNYRREEMFQFI